MRTADNHDSVIAFLKSNSAYYGDIDTKKAVRIFMEDMKRGLDGEESSLPMIPTYIETEREIPRGKKVVALDAGGTNLRAAVFSIDPQGKPIIENFRKGTMPGFHHEVSAGEFFQTFADFIEDIAGISDTIGFCFSYPAEIFPGKDGKLIQFTKEIKAPEVEGSVIGENLIRYLGSSKASRVILLNDTVADLLAGMAAHQDKKYGSYIGFILGTGINACYIESNDNITKIRSSDPGGSQVINIEAGFFNKMPRGRLDDMVDSDTQKPGVQLFEKMISGAYFGKLCTVAIKEAAAAGLFTKDTNTLFSESGPWSTADVDRFLHNPWNADSALIPLLDGIGGSDRNMVFHLINDLLERTALMTSVSMAAIILKSGKGDDPLYPIGLGIDGTTFYRFFDFRFRVEKYLREILSGDIRRYYEILQIEDAPLIGAGIAGLIN